MPRFSTFAAPPVAHPVEIRSIDGREQIPIVAGPEDPYVLVGPGGDFPEVTAAAVLSPHWDHTVYRNGNVLAGATSGVWVRRSTALCFDHIQRYLDTHHPGLHVVVFDGLRLPDAQSGLYEAYLGALRRKHAGEKGWDEARLEVEAAKYVSKPSTDSRRPPMHSAGAVDCVLVELSASDERTLRQSIGARASMRGATEPAIAESLERTRFVVSHGRQLFFGTRFDHGGERAAAGYYRTKQQLTFDDEVAHHNREFLYSLWSLPWVSDQDLNGADRLRPYEHEWWHAVSSQSQAGAMYLGVNVAHLSGVYGLSAEQQKADYLLDKCLSSGANRSGLLPIERIVPECAGTHAALID